jgi:Ca2+-binding RTX toxin-like protein
VGTGGGGTAGLSFSEGTLVSRAASNGTPRVVIAYEAPPDTTAPSVTITKNSGQTDPTSTDPIDFTVEFSEPVTGFADDDIELSGTANPLSATVTGAGTTYNVAVSGMHSSGTVIAKVKTGAAIDSASNQSTASGTASVVFELDTTAPTVTINQAPGQNDPTMTEPVKFAVKFSEPVTGFGSGSEDVILSGTAVGQNTSWSVESGAVGDSEYTIAVEGLTAPGTVIATVKAGAAKDNNQNLNTASTSTDNSVYFGTPPVQPVTCGGRTATMKGTDSNDTLSGTAGPDVIAGLGGNDKITGAAGNDIICGGDGNDTIDGGSGNDTLEGGAGTDNLIGGSGSPDKCDGGSNTDSGGSGCETKVSLP